MHEDFNYQSSITGGSHGGEGVQIFDADGGWSSLIGDFLIYKKKGCVGLLFMSRQQHHRGYLILLTVSSIVDRTVVPPLPTPQQASSQLTLFSHRLHY
jgi:hypothetical protein